MSPATVKYILWAGAVVLLQLLIFRHLRFFGAEPDLTLAFLVWVMAYSDRTTAIMLGGGMGFILDIFLDQWGINMIAKVAVAFLAYRFVPKVTETKLVISQVFVVLLLVSLFHNLIFLGVAFFAQSRVDLIFWNFLIGNALFTSIVASFIYLFKSN